MSKGDAESIHYMEKARDMENGGERERKKKEREKCVTKSQLRPSVLKNKHTHTKKKKE